MKKSKKSEKSENLRVSHPWLMSDSNSFEQNPSLFPGFPGHKMKSQDISRFSRVLTTMRILDYVQIIAKIRKTRKTLMIKLAGETYGTKIQTNPDKKILKIRNSRQFQTNPDKSRLFKKNAIIPDKSRPLGTLFLRKILTEVHLRNIAGCKYGNIKKHSG